MRHLALRHVATSRPPPVPRRRGGRAAARGVYYITLGSLFLFTAHADSSLYLEQRRGRTRSPHEDTCTVRRKQLAPNLNNTLRYLHHTRRSTAMYTHSPHSPAARPHAARATPRTTRSLKHALTRAATPCAVLSMCRTSIDSRHIRSSRPWRSSLLRRVPRRMHHPPFKPDPKSRTPLAGLPAPPQTDASQCCCTAPRPCHVVHVRARRSALRASGHCHRRRGGSMLLDDHAAGAPSHRGRAVVRTTHLAGWHRRPQLPASSRASGSRELPPPQLSSELSSRPHVSRARSRSCRKLCTRTVLKFSLAALNV